MSTELLLAKLGALINDENVSVAIKRNQPDSSGALFSNVAGMAWRVWLLSDEYSDFHFNELHAYGATVDKAIEGMVALVAQYRKTQIQKHSELLSKASEMVTEETSRE